MELDKARKTPSSENACALQNPQFMVLLRTIMANLARFLEASQYFKLIRCGSPEITAIVKRNWTEIDLPLSARPLFPFSALELPNLNSLVIGSTPIRGRYVKIGSRALYNDSVRSNSLKTLVMAFWQSGSLLRKCSPRKPLGSRFPELTTLELRDTAPFTWIVPALEFLPPKLTSLVLTVRQWGEDAPLVMPISTIAGFPRSLTNLEIRWHVLDAQSYSQPWSELFPPELLHLNLSALNSLTLLDHLPIHLQTLSVSAGQSRQPVTWKVSKMPPGLVNLLIDSATATFQFELDANWPNSLREFLVLTRQNLSILPTLPSTLTRLQIPDTSGTGDEQLLKQFPNLTYVNIYEEGQSLGVFPKNATSLYLSASRIPFALPNTLKSLTTGDINIDEISYLPSSLKSLRLQQTYASDSPKLSCESLSLFPKYLTSLDIAAGILDAKKDAFGRDEPPQLLSLKNLFFLRSLRIASLPLFWGNLGSQLLINCLPPLLKSLSLQFIPGDDANIAHDSDLKIGVSCSWLSSLRLADSTPYLDKFYLNGDMLYDIPLGDWFETLPTAIDEIYLSNLTRLFELSAISKLPRKLTSLSVFFEITYEELEEEDNLDEPSADEEMLSAEHFRGLPLSLTSMSFVAPKNSNISSNLLLYLPPDLYEVGMTLPNMRHENLLSMLALRTEMKLQEY